MKRIRYIAVISFIILTYHSCSNKIDIAGPYEENAAIFALLDPSQQVQYIKINKTFTNPSGSAKDIARISDSLYFDSLTPTLTEIETGRVIPLFKVNLNGKAQGVFASSPNYLYATGEKIYANDPMNNYDFYHYRFDLDLPGGKKHLSAITNIPDSVVLLAPADIALPGPKIVEFGGTLRLAFQAPSNSKLFDAWFYFNYLEMNKADTNIRTVKTLKWRLINNYRTTDDNSHESIQTSINVSFYDFLLSRLTEDTNVIRKFLPCKLEVTAANLEFDNYMQASTPSIGIVQKQTDYSNIVNGVGLFASRRISRYNAIIIGPYTRKTLVTMPQYAFFGFMN